MPETERGLASRARNPYLGRAWNNSGANFRRRSERAEAAALIMPHADTQAMSAHLAEIENRRIGAHASSHSGWRAGTVRQSWRYPTTSPSPLNCDGKCVGLSACQQARHIRLRQLSIFRCCEAWNFFANDKTAITTDNGPKRSTTRAVGIIRQLSSLCGSVAIVSINGTPSFLV